MPRFWKHRRFQFSLRSALVATVAFAGFLSLACSTGFLEASGTAAALTLMALAIRCQRGGKFILLRVAAGMLALGVLWFVALDWSWFVEDCEYCRSCWDIAQYRVYRIPVCETTIPHQTAIARIAEDLGVPCPHKLRRWHRYRLWGLLYCARPAIHGTVRLDDDDGYDERMAEVVRSMARSDPDLPEEYRRRVLLEFDKAYWRRFCQKLDSLRNADRGTGRQSGNHLPSSPNAEAE